MRGIRCKALTMVWLLVVSVFVAGSASAGVSIQFNSRNLEDPSESQTGTMQIEGRKLRIDDLAGEQGEKLTMLFDGSQKVLTYVDHNKRTYFEMSAEQMKTVMAGFSDQMKAAKAQLEQQMANMSPDQRKAMEDMMKDGMGDMMNTSSEARPELDIRKTGETKSIDGHECRRYDLYRGDEKETEAWVADWGSVGIDEDIFTNVFQDLGVLFDDMMQALPAGAAQDNPFEAFGKLPGFPMLTRDFEDGEATQETEVLSFGKQSFGSAIFAPPMGYKMVDPFQR